MRLYELLNEDVSKETSVRNISDILTTELPELYRKLEKMADNYARDKGEINKGYYFITGSTKSNWYHNVFVKSMKASLYNLAKSLPQNVRGQLSNFLNTTIGYDSFSQVEDSLVGIIAAIGKVTKNSELSHAAEAANHAINHYKSHLIKLNSDAADDDYDEPAAPKVNTPNPIAQQNNAANSIIDQTLARLDRNQAGEIRNAIARSGNKLAALQQELTRRGIVLN
jgi:hypothetical protein